MPSKNPLLRSLEKDAQEEVPTVITRGEIPKWIEGVLFRNGPGRYTYGKAEYEHFLDGHACIHKFRIKDGQVFYSNRFLQSEHYLRSKNDERCYPVFGTADPCSTMYGRFQTFFYGTDPQVDNTAVNICSYGPSGDLYALTESSLYNKLDPITLDIQQVVSVSKNIKGAYTSFAHPHIESSDGTWYSMGISDTKQKPMGYNFIRYRGGEEARTAEHIAKNGEIVAKVPSSHGSSFSYIHSFGMTDNYLVYFECALVISASAYLVGLVTNRSLADCMYMDKEFKTRIHIVNKKTGEIDIRHLETDPMFSFHHCNTFEKYDKNGKCSEIVADICSYNADEFHIKELSWKKGMRRENQADNQLGGRLSRVTIPMNTTGTADNVLPIHCKLERPNESFRFEFPIWNYDKVNGKPYRFMWGTDVFSTQCKVVKIDFENPKDVLEFAYESKADPSVNYWPSEVAFVASPNPQSEDDGVLLVQVLAEEADFLSVLDAKTLKELGRAELPTEARGAVTFHGFFSTHPNHVKPEQRSPQKA